MGRFQLRKSPRHDDWIEHFQERVTPRLRNLFTSNHDFSVLPEIIAEPLRRLALAELSRS